MVEIKIISSSKFEKINMRNKVYMEMSGEIWFDNVVADNLFDLVFACIAIF